MSDAKSENTKLPPTSLKREIKREAEHEGSIWKHPYLIYVALTMVLFSFLIIAGYLALNNGWLPKTGV